MELKDNLMKLARDSGICKDGYIRMANSTKDELIEFYLESPDWCMERDYPTLPFLKEHFHDIENKGVFVGKTFHGELLNGLQTYVFHGCKGTIKVGLNVEKGIIPMLYVANGCRLRIVGTGDVEPKPKERSRVPVYEFGKNDVSARDNRYVVFKRYKNEMI